MKTQKIHTDPMDENGLTLIEMLMAVSILVIIGGSAYFAFKTAVDAYHQTQARVLAAQRCRFAMDRIVTDLSNMQVSVEDPELALYTQDGPSQSGDRDMISFVTLVRTDPDPFAAQLSSFQSPSVSQVPLPLLSDVQRVAYFVAAEPMPGQSAFDSASLQDSFAENASGEEIGTSALFRVSTTTLNPETVIGPILETGNIPETDENGEPIYVDIATLITGLTNFDLQYFDGETEVWNDSWDDQESIPSTVRILISVQSEIEGPVSTNTTTQFTTQNQPAIPSNGMTQSTMVYLRASATAGGGAQGAPQGGQ